MVSKGYTIEEEEDAGAVQWHFVNLLYFSWTEDKLSGQSPSTDKGDDVLGPHDGPRGQSAIPGYSQHTKWKSRRQGKEGAEEQQPGGERVDQEVLQ